MAHVNMSSTRVLVAKLVDPCSEGIGPATLARSRASASKRPERPEPKVTLGSKLPHPSKKSCNCLLMCPIRATCSLLVGRLKAARSTGFPLTATKLEVAMTKSKCRSSSESPFDAHHITPSSLHDVEEDTLWILVFSQLSKHMVYLQTVSRQNPPNMLEEYPSREDKRLGAYH